MVRTSGGELVWLGPVDALGCEDVKGMHGVRVASQEHGEVNVKRGRPFWFGAEVGTSAVPQFGG